MLLQNLLSAKSQSGRNSSKGSEENKKSFTLLLGFLNETIKDQSVVRILLRLITAEDFIHSTKVRKNIIIFV